MTKKSNRTISRGLRATALVAATGLALVACGSSGDTGTSTGTGGDGEVEVGTQDASFLTVATGGSSGVYYQVGATMSQMLGRELDADTSAQATGASVENINLITDGNAELAFSLGDAVVQAMEGTGPFEGDVRENLTAISALYPNFVQIVTTASSGIASVEDLAGKRVAVGDVGSGTELNAQTILGAYDMSYEDINEDYLSFAEAIDQMRNGQVDAAFVSSGLPNAAITDLSTTTDVVLIPIEGQAREDLFDEYDYFGDSTIPAATYGTDGDVTTVSITNQLLVSSELSEDAVYDITRVLFDNLDELHNSHNAARDITLESVQDGLVAPMHPGAERYFVEQGVLDE
jgi:TRAP transporter TAXI family solute receptor